MEILTVRPALNFCLPGRDIVQNGGQCSMGMWSAKNLCLASACQDPDKNLLGSTDFGTATKSITGRHPLLGVNRVSTREADFQANSRDQKYLPGEDLGRPTGGETAPLIYKPYMDHLWRTLMKRTPDLHSLPLHPDMRLQESKKGSKVFNWLFAANRLCRIRMTYFDGGSGVQAFNSLLYPDCRYDIPLLGIDLLSFGAKKVLCVIDFTPLCQDVAYLDKYTSQLGPIRAEIAQHCGRMTSKFYDENQFFSKELIFYRSSLGAQEPILKVPGGLLFKTYVSYIDNYLQILQGAKANEDPLQMSYVASQQSAYNVYSKDRDPAIKMFNSQFGMEWSERFVNNFLFPQMPAG